MRSVWDAVAATGSERLLGRAEEATAQLDRLFAQLDAAARGGTCVEIGCGAGRMTAVLAERYERVVAVDVSPAMLERARAAVTAPNVEFALGLRGVADASADAAVCFGVVQHLPRPQVVASLLVEAARVLRPGGEALVQLPVLHGDLRSRVWRLAHGPAAAIARRRNARNLTLAAEYRGTRLTWRELEPLVARAGLRIAAHVVDDDPTLYSTYPHADDVRLRLVRE